MVQAFFPFLDTITNMKQYKHYSFSLWKTLIVSHPDFKWQMAKYFAEHFNPTVKSIEEIIRIFKVVDDTCSFTNEIIGQKIDAFEMYAMVLFQLKYKEPVEMQSIYSNCVKLFEKYPPILIEQDILPVLRSLKQHSTISIISNTGFIKSTEIRYVLQNLGIKWLIDFDIYSDEIGYSKPSTIAYNHLLHKIEEINPGIEESSILHIGDNPNADGVGAKNAMIDFILFNPDTEKLSDLVIPKTIAVNA